MQWRMTLALLALALTACGGSARSPTVTSATATPPALPSVTPTTATTQTPAPSAPSSTATATPGSATIGLPPTVRTTAPPGSAASSSGGTPANAEMRVQLAAAELRWQQSGASNYRIMVTTTTFNIAQTDTITVQGGKVADQSATCNPLPSSGSAKLCQVQKLPPETLTVPGLFDTTRQLTTGTAREGTVTFDARYGYPMEISSKVRNTYDTEENKKVTGFAVLP